MRKWVPPPLGSLEEEKSWFDTLHRLWKWLLETLLWFWENESGWFACPPREPPFLVPPNWTIPGDQVQGSDHLQTEVPWKPGAGASTRGPFRKLLPGYGMLSWEDLPQPQCDTCRALSALSTAGRLAGGNPGSSPRSSGGETVRRDGFLASDQFPSPSL